MVRGGSRLRRRDPVTAETRCSPSIISEGLMIAPRRTFAAGALSFLALCLAGLSPPASAAAPPIAIAVDASEAPRKIFHARLVVPAPPGPLTLLYPKWIPGEHGPSGPIADL